MRAESVEDRVDHLRLEDHQHREDLRLQRAVHLHQGMEHQKRQLAERLIHQQGERP